MSTDTSTGLSTRAKVYLRNRDILTSHGNIALRKAAVEIIEYALQAANPYTAVRRLVQLDGHLLSVGDLVFDLKRYERVFVMGAGKASLPIAQALEDILGDRISDGLFVLKHGSRADLNRTKVIYAAHPVPDENGHKGAQAMMEMAEGFAKNDLVFVGISGGSSALLPLPVEGVSLADKQKVNQVLLHCGADITEINAVRKHLSRIKGGWLAKAILPATLVNLTVSDVVGDPLDYITGPTVPDTSTFDDARGVLDRYELWEAFPESAADYLRSGGEAQETPKDFGDAPVYTFLIVDSTAACLGAAERAAELGYKPMILTTMLKGEAREAGTFFAAIANEIVRFGRPMSAPCAIVAGGENTVTIPGEYGRGGPNQELALSACLDLVGLENVVLVAIDTDGTDGPTDLAGGIVDGSTLPAAQAKEIDVFRALHDHDASRVLQELGDAIITGHTGTNVNDLRLLLVG
ncbi:MAG: glycerate kinase [Anaerolineales bacterium]|nr:MAG: glycerate kinase [Anaerolineales bacterium]